MKKILKPFSCRIISTLCIIAVFANCYGFFSVPVKKYPDQPSYLSSYRAAVDYSGYRGVQCPGGNFFPSEDDVLKDLLILEKNFEIVRLHGADVFSERVLKAIKNNDLKLKVFLGAWLGDETKNSSYASINETQVKKATMLAAEYPDIVEGICVGSEFFYNWTENYNKALLQYFLKYINMARVLTDVPLSTAEPDKFWETDLGTQVASCVDYITYHTYPQWSGKYLKESIQYIENVHEHLEQLYPGKPLLLGETGWATHSTNHPSVINNEATDINQATYMNAILNWAKQKNITVFMFEAFDELWKGNDGKDEIERHWGIYDSNRQPKVWINSIKRSVRSRN